jgi:hypothetical protein
LTVTITRPTAPNQAFGGGFVVAAQTTTLMSTGWYWSGELRDTTGQISGGTAWWHPWVSGSQAVQGTYGVDQRSNVLAAFGVDSRLAHGASAVVLVHVNNPNNQIVDTGQLAVTLDFLSGTQSLLQFAGAGGSGGHDPMLDTILDAVTNPYVNSA